MSRTITSISYMLSGSAVLVFILALLTPLLRELPPLAEKVKTEVYKSGYFKQTMKALELGHTQIRASNNAIQSSITQPSSEVVANDTGVAQEQGESSAIESLQASTEPHDEVMPPPVKTLIELPQTDDTSDDSAPAAPNDTGVAQESGESSAIESLQASTEPHDEGMPPPVKTLIELPQTDDTSGDSAPVAPNETGVAQEQVESGAIKSLQASTEPHDEVMPPPAKTLTESPQTDDASGDSAPVASNETGIAQEQVESGAIESLQTSTEPPPHEKSDEPANPNEVEEKKTPPHHAMRVFVLGGGLFPPGEVTATAKVVKEIDKIIPIIKARPWDKVVVEGHADRWLLSGDTPEHLSRSNKDFSLRRARAVANVLEQKGVASDRIIVKGLGDVVPIASNTTRSGRAKNRRVEIKLTSAQQ